MVESDECRHVVFISSIDAPTFSFHVSFVEDVIERGRTDVADGALGKDVLSRVGYGIHDKYAGRTTLGCTRGTAGVCQRAS